MSPAALGPYSLPLCDGLLSSSTSGSGIESPFVVEKLSGGAWHVDTMRMQSTSLLLPSVCVSGLLWREM